MEGEGLSSVGTWSPGWSSAGAAPGVVAGFGRGVSVSGNARSLVPCLHTQGDASTLGKNADSWALPAGDF